jgi:hypothetical protein
MEPIKLLLFDCVFIKQNQTRTPLIKAFIYSSNEISTLFLQKNMQNIIKLNFKQCKKILKEMEEQKIFVSKLVYMKSAIYSDQFSSCFNVCSLTFIYLQN